MSAERATFLAGTRVPTPGGPRPWPAKAAYHELLELLDVVHELASRLDAEGVMTLFASVDLIRRDRASEADYDRTDPWETLLRLPRHVMLEWRDLQRADGLYELDVDGHARIVLAARLGRRDRWETLAHELTHRERGIVFTDDTPSAFVYLEEAVVERLARERYPYVTAR